MAALPDPIPAATLVLTRPGPDGLELLMIERGPGMAFAPGALVFPGGRIDPDDRLIGGDEVGAAAVAAVRETIEETGIAVALKPSPAPEAQAGIRRALASGTPFSALLVRYGLLLDRAALVPFARWCPNFRETRRFDTLFFIAEGPADAAEPVADEGEAVRAMWTRAADVLTRADRGEAHIIFPTRRNLERLAGFASFADAARDAARHSLDKIVPWIEERGGEPWLCIAGDRGYPVTAERLQTALRR